MENKEELTTVSKQEALDVLNKNFKSFKVSLEAFKNRFNSDEINEFYQNYLMDKTKEFNCVYFIRNKYNNLVKIGCTTDITKRFKELNSICKNYFGMEDALEIEGIIYIPYGVKCEIYESQIHKELQKENKFGEWFDISLNEILDYYFHNLIYYNGIFVDYLDTYWINKNIENYTNFNLKKYTDKNIKISIFKNIIQKNNKYSLQLDELYFDFIGEEYILDIFQDMGYIDVYSEFYGLMNNTFYGENKPCKEKIMRTHIEKNMKILMDKLGRELFIHEGYVSNK